MKTKTPLIFSLTFFLLLNTSGLWNKLPGLWDLSILLVLLASFITILVTFIILLVKILRSKDITRQLRINFYTIGVIVMLTIIFPFGIRNHRLFEGTILFTAQAEGAANCTTTITLKPERKFIKRSVCFGVDEIRGSYIIENDTIKLYENKHDENEYSYGVIEKESAKDTLGTFKYYSSIEDSIPSYYDIFHNEILKTSP